MDLTEFAGVCCSVKVQIDFRFLAFLYLGARLSLVPFHFLKLYLWAFDFFPYRFMGNQSGLNVMPIAWLEILCTEKKFDSFNIFSHCICERKTHKKEIHRLCNTLCPSWRTYWVVYRLQDSNQSVKRAICVLIWHNDIMLHYVWDIKVIHICCFGNMTWNDMWKRLFRWYNKDYASIFQWKC